MTRHHLSELLTAHEFYTLPVFKNAMVTAQIKRVTFNQMYPYWLYACGIKVRMLPDDDEPKIVIKFNSPKHLRPFKQALMRDTAAYGFWLDIRTDPRKKTLSLH